MTRVVLPADVAALEERSRGGFEERFGRPSELVTSAPGRANLIGEHTDYNDGFVLPFALARRTAVAAARRRDRIVRVASALAPGTIEFFLDARIDRGQPRWGDYVKGVVVECLARAPGGPALDPGGFDAWVDSDVPVGAGLSSSAALEVAVATLLETLAGNVLEPQHKADLCRRAENGFVGVPSGIMDQMASVLATPDTLLFIDCRDHAWRRIALPPGQVELVIVDSQLPHDLGQGAYALRVQQCREAAARLGVRSLRDATRAQVESLARDGDAVLHARALHVVDENARVLAAVDAVAASDWTGLGAILDAGHASLRDLYEVSRPEMDALVLELRRAGALGARMTGGGFGGCAVALFPFGSGAARRLAGVFG